MKFLLEIFAVCAFPYGILGEYPVKIISPSAKKSFVENNNEKIVWKYDKDNTALPEKINIFLKNSNTSAHDEIMDISSWVTLSDNEYEWTVPNNTRGVYKVLIKGVDPRKKSYIYQILGESEKFEIRSSDPPELKKEKSADPDRRNLNPDTAVKKTNSSGRKDLEYTSASGGC
ncbi:hypothetical protein BB560_000598 [Smittium megazygosporum]|uniref:Uncharacterized protein n=1 Tax=Smittium megazygosporum TaxID=133381 RepID=A0A2T9ZJX4_9FUNG|nr:hypothetical protein BB560_000598 [Smittium megazygosporum]